MGRQSSFPDRQVVSPVCCPTPWTCKRCHISSCKVNSRGHRSKALTHPSVKTTCTRNASPPVIQPVQHLLTDFKPVLWHLAAPGPSVGEEDMETGGLQWAQGGKGRRRQWVQDCTKQQASSSVLGDRFVQGFTGLGSSVTPAALGLDSVPALTILNSVKSPPESKPPLWNRKTPEVHKLTKICKSGIAILN